MPEFVRVTDDVKPRREYSVVAEAVDPTVHTVLKDKAGASPDGSPIPPKYTPSELAPRGYDGWKVPGLRAEIDRRSAERDEPIQVEEPGNKPELVAALLADDEANSE